MNIHALDIFPGKGQGHKTLKCNGLKWVKKIERKTPHYNFVILTYNLIGPKISGNVQNTIMNEICFVIRDILIFENVDF